jgi:hypothetical protein
MLRGVPREAKEREIVAVATAMIGGEINLIEGCRQINGLMHEIDDPACWDLHRPFIAVDSETDHLPFGELRKLWHPDFLPQADEEAEKYLASRRPMIIEACQRIIQAFGPTTPAPSGPRAG